MITGAGIWLNLNGIVRFTRQPLNHFAYFAFVIPQEPRFSSLVFLQNSLGQGYSSVRLIYVTGSWLDPEFIPNWRTLQPFLVIEYIMTRRKIGGGGGGVEAACKR